MYERSETAPKTAHVAMVVLGDSLAFGLGATASERGLAGRLFARLRSEFPGSTYANIAVPHATMGDVLRHQVPQLQALNAGVVVLIAGANDLRYTRDALIVARRFRHLLQAVHLAAPGAQVLAGGMPDVTQTIGVPKLLKPAVSRICRRLNGTMRAIVDERGDHFIDIFASTNAPLRAEPSCLLCDDGYHPNDEGYAEIGDRALPALAAAMVKLA